MKGTSMLTLTEAADQIRNRKVSSLELTRACLERIERLNPKLNAFITVTDDLALQQATRADTEIGAGNWRGALHGIPVAMKDLIDLAGVPTTAASRQLVNNVPVHDAGIVARLKDAGAVIVGKTNLHEFAFGGSGMVSAYGPARNPWDKARITGGSSSGSAAALASGMCIAAIGTDTAGSVRIPASLCGIVGHRPGAGVWSTSGIIPLRRSFDTAGPMARSARDALLMLHALSDTDTEPKVDESVNHLRVGVARKGFFDGCDSEVAKCVEQAVDVIRLLAASVVEVNLEVPIRWTDFNEEILDYHRSMMEHSPELYQPATLERLRACASISPADYEQARDSLAAARRDAERVFEAVDVVVTPTCLVAAPEVSTLQAMTDSNLRAFEVQKLLHNTAPFNLLYWPSVSVPCGFTVQGLPVGLQISARPGADDRALASAGAYEQATEWHKRVPPLAF
jgi:aspartyl-tRNA(Asn)/glutamyl-tRNA(Gln) amidotransferase subunit A